MKRLLFVLMIIVFALLQSSVLNYFRFFGAKPDLFLIAVAIASLIFKPAHAFFLSIFCGFLKDVIGVSAFGLNSVVFLLLSLLIVRISKIISFEDYYLYPALIAITVLASNIFVAVILSFTGNFIPFWVFLRSSLLESAYTALIFPWVFKTARLLFLRV